MFLRSFISVVCLAAACLLGLLQQEVTLAAEPAPQIKLADIPVDLTVPAMTADQPAAGKRVKEQLAAYQQTSLFHALYLPSDWKPGQKYPVIFEYPGNGPYQNKLGDTNSGKLEDCQLGYGATGGKGVIWVCLPLVDSQQGKHTLQWWGDPAATVAYCKGAIEHVCTQYGGDRQRLILAGFSRGSIAANYIGLRDAELAKAWRGFIAHSHYDGVRKWPYADSDPASAKERLARLEGRPQFISHEASTADVEAWLKTAGAKGDFTFVPLPFENHTSGWVLRDIPARRALRDWLAKVLAR